VLKVTGLSGKPMKKRWARPPAFCKLVS
jgi:hypothetical protein